MTNKEQYAVFCQGQPDLPLTMQPWWLDAVCAGKQWDVMLFTRADLDGGKKKEQGAKTDEVLAAMPYLLRKRLGYTFIVMPQMTMFGGIWLSSELHASPALQEQLAKLVALRLRKMKIAYYYQQYPVGNPMPYWLEQQKMKVEERVTYRIDNLADKSAIEGDYSKNKQRQLKRAGDLELDYEMTAEEFFAFHKQCMAERGRKLTYSREFLLVLERKASRACQSAFIRIVEGAKNKEQGTKIEEQGARTVAAAFVVWDKRYMYYLIPAYLPSAAETGASARLADEAIRLAKQKGLLFDFEGGNDDPGIANHYRQFGSQPATYRSVSKLYRPSFAILLWLNKLRERMRYA